MMDSRVHAPPPHTVLEQAAQWYAVLRDGKAGTQQHANWQAWLHADASHRVAWRYVEDISRDFDPLRGQPDARLSADALNASKRHRQTRRHVLAGIGALAGTSALGWLSWREAWLPASVMAWGADHRTGVGEQRMIQLADGSQVWLNTATAINVQIEAHQRLITLLEGEIFVTTAHAARGQQAAGAAWEPLSADGPPQGGKRPLGGQQAEGAAWGPAFAAGPPQGKSRPPGGQQAEGAAWGPFYIQTEFGRLQALGTRFNVRREAGQTRLAVYEGAVEIRATHGASRVVMAGQQASFNANDISTPEAADVAREAWTQGALIADNIPLRAVIEELRRYRRGHLGIADEVAQLTVYGNFPVQEPERVLRMLASALPIRISQPLPWWTSIEARD